MKIKESVVVKKDGKFFTGFLNGYIFTINDEIKKLKDVKSVSDYITLNNWAKNNGYKKEDTDILLEKTGCEKIYILDSPINPSVEEFEEYWWKEENHICKDCKNKCKQSYKVEVYSCNKFEAK